MTPAETSLLLILSAIFGINVKRKIANASDCATSATAAQITKSTIATEFEAALPNAMALSGQSILTYPVCAKHSVSNPLP